MSAQPDFITYNGAGRNEFEIDFDQWVNDSPSMNHSSIDQIHDGDSSRSSAYEQELMGDFPLIPDVGSSTDSSPLDYDMMNFDLWQSDDEIFQNNPNAEIYGGPALHSTMPDMYEMYDNGLDSQISDIIEDSTALQCSSSGQLHREPKRRRRFPASTVAVLEQRFLIDDCPSLSTASELAESTELSVKQVKNWFLNKRNRMFKRNERRLFEPTTKSHLISDQEFLSRDGSLASDRGDIDAGHVHRGRTAECQASSTSISRSSTCSAFSQCSDAVLNHPPRRGRKRQCSEQSRTRRAKRIDNTAEAQKAENSEMTEKFQCTFCYQELSSKSWKRHEESKHLPQTRYTCLGEGWCVPPERQGVLSRNCVFCGEHEPPESHRNSCHRIADCLARPSEDRVYFRRDHLIQHLKQFHNIRSLSDQVVSTWTSPVSKDYTKQIWSCGFCGMVLKTWNIRAAHIAKHFRAGLDMSSWKLSNACAQTAEGVPTTLIEPVLPKESLASKTSPIQGENVSENVLKSHTTQRFEDDRDLTCGSLNIGSWSFFSGENRKLCITYSPEQSCITYTMTSGTSKFMMRYPFAAINNIVKEEPQGDHWYQDSEVPFTIQLKRAPWFCVQTLDMDAFQQSHDFTEGSQASISLTHNLVGHKDFLDYQIMDLRQSTTSALAPLSFSFVADEGAIIPPLAYLSDSEFSRHCPFCYKSYPNPCGTLSHSFYSSCSSCGKKISSNHECMPPPNRVLISKFVCSGKLPSGQKWGCGASFIDNTSLHQHLFYEESGSGCREPFVAETNAAQAAQAADLADLFAIKCSLDNGQALLGSKATFSPSSAQTVIRYPVSVPDSAPAASVDLMWKVLSDIMANSPSQNG